MKKSMNVDYAFQNNNKSDREYLCQVRMGLERDNRGQSKTYKDYAGVA